MRAIRSYESLLAVLGDIFCPRYRQSGQNVRMVGVVFARPESDLGRSVATQRHKYWHFRSGEYIDFFWPGYEYDWSFNAEVFNDFRREFESKTRWKYRGTSELIFLDAKYDPNYRSDSCPCGRGYLDFSTALCIDLDAFTGREGDFAVDRVFEEVFRAAEKGLGERPTHSFAIEFGLTSSAKAFWFTIISYLPEPLKEMLSGKYRVPIVRSITKKEGKT